MRLEINVHDDRKIVEIWLSHSEQADAALREQIRPIYQEYNGKNTPWQSFSPARKICMSRPISSCSTIETVRQNWKRNSRHR